MNNFDYEQIIKYVPKEKQEKAFLLLKSGYPIQYIIGNVDFMGYQIDVNENVLIPRFETEYLVSDLITLLKENHYENPNILDIGTGSGCISIVLNKVLKNNVTGIDINASAIKLAKENAQKHDAQIEFINVSIEDYVPQKKFDVLVSNPPYVSIGSPIDEKIKYEPQNAIFADEEGLYFYRIILSKAKQLLNNKNIIAFEIGHGQQEKIDKLILQEYPNAKIINKKDLNGYERYIFVINE